MESITSRRLARGRELIQQFMLEEFPNAETRHAAYAMWKRVDTLHNAAYALARKEITE